MKTFLCHSSKDKCRVHEIYSHVPDDIVTWIDEEDLLVGEDFGAVIEKVIQERVDFLVVFLSTWAVKSVFVKKELTWALEREQGMQRPFLLPVLLEKGIVDSIEPPFLRDALSNRHYLACLEQDRESVRAAGMKLAEHLTRLEERYLSRPPQDLEDVIQDATDQLRNRNYPDCEETLKWAARLHAESAEVLWLFHLLHFEKACLTQDKDRKKERTEKCTSYYRRAVRSDPRLGILPDDYEVVGPLGFGGLSHVYEVRSGDEFYAAKAIREEVLVNRSQRKEYVRHLPDIMAMTHAWAQAEARTEEASCAHGNRSRIARIESWRDSERKLVVVYERIVGESLQRHIETIRREKPSELETEAHYVRCLTVLERVCAALSFAHKAGVFHLDVSPMNILIEDAGGAWNETSSTVLIDFDMARLASGAGGVSVSVAMNYASTQYMDPQFLKKGGYGLSHEDLRRADVYSVARTAKMMFCGSPDSQRKASEVCLVASPVLEEIIAAGTDEEPSKRLESAEQMMKCFRYLIGMAKRRRSESVYSKAALFTLALLSAYLLLLIPLSFLKRIDNYLYVAVVVSGIVCGGPLLYAAFFDLFRVDGVINDARSRRSTDFLIVLWVTCAGVIVLATWYYLLAVSAALLGSAARLLLYKRDMADAPRAWQLTKEGIPFLVLGMVLSVLGFGTQLVVVEVYPKQWPLALVLYNLVAVFFSYMNIRSCVKVWESKLGSMARARGWRNLTGG